jgi:hypothetical protein
MRTVKRTRTWWAVWMPEGFYLGDGDSLGPWLYEKKPTANKDERLKGIRWKAVKVCLRRVR